MEHPYGATLTTKEAARVLGLSHRTLEQHRLRGSGPPYVRLGRRQLRYLKSDLTAYLLGHRHDPAAPPKRLN